MSRDREQIEYLQALAQALMARGELDQAARKLEKASELDGNDATTQKMLSEIRARKKELGTDEDLIVDDIQIADIDAELRLQTNEPTGAADLAGQTHLSLPSITDDELEEVLLQAKVIDKKEPARIIEEVEIIEDVEIVDPDDPDGSAIVVDPGWADVSDQVSSKPAEASRLSAGGGRYIWGVTTELDVPHNHPLPYAMDTGSGLGDLPLATNVMIFYPSLFGEFPNRGLHEIFYRVAGGYERVGSGGGNYRNWNDRLDDWLKRHERKLAIYLEKIFSKEERFSGGEHTVGLIARGGWNAVAELTPNQRSANPDPLASDGDFLDDWEECVAAINDPWDASFLAQFHMRVPDRSQHFKDLITLVSHRRKAARKEILKRSWQHFSRTFLLSTLKTCKRICPKIQWGFLGYPNTPFAEIPDSSRHDQIREFNDRLQWLWEAQDVIAPSFTVNRYSVATGAHGPQQVKTNTPEQDRQMVENCVNEALRVRETFAKGKPVLSVHPYSYTPAAGGGLLNDINMAHQLRLPLQMGVDGVVITGHLNHARQKAVVERELAARLARVVKQSQP